MLGCAKVGIHEEHATAESLPYGGQAEITARMDWREELKS